MKALNNKKAQFISKVALIVAILYIFPILLAFLVYIGLVPAYIIFQEHILEWDSLNLPWLVLLLTLSSLPAGLAFWWLFRFPQLLELCFARKNSNKSQLKQLQYENSHMRVILQHYYDLEKDIVALSQQKRAYYLDKNQTPTENIHALHQRLDYFLRQTAHNLALDCVADVIFIATFSDNKQALQPHMCWEQGQFCHLRSWAITDFPDTGGIENDVFIYQDALVNYPSKLIQHYKAQSYFSIPLCSPTGEQMGVLCLMATETNTLSPDLLVILNIYAHYIAMLLEWKTQQQSEKTTNYAHSQTFNHSVLADSSLEQDTSPARPILASATKIPKLKTASNSGANLLVAEDSEINQVVINKILQRLGYQADYADNGYEALQLWQQNHYDLIFMDCQMPKMDGYHTTEQIRKIEQEQDLDHTPIIALTAYSLSKHKERAKKAGMDDHISKPIKVGILQDLLTQYLPTEKLQTQVKNTTDTVSTPTVKHGSPVLNPAIMQDLNKTLGNQLAVLLQQFIQYLPEQIDLLAETIEQKNLDLLRRKAHQLKGESMQIGAETLGSLCKELETFANHQELAQAEKHLDLMRVELSRVIQALKAENEKITNPVPNE